MSELANDDVITIELQADNRILIGGYFTQYNTVSKNHIARLIHCSPSSSTAQIEACSSFTWIDGITYTNSTNAPTFVLPNSAGCDSTITLHLTINHPSTATFIETACNTFTLNNQTYAQSGIYAQQLINATGCDSTIILNLTIPLINTSVSQNQSTLTSAASTGTYQWIDCATMTVVAGETSQTFTATQDGSYAVIVTENGCSDTSECIEVDVLGLQQYGELTDLLIYPNPSKGYFKGEFSAPVNEQTEIIVSDQTGRIVATQTIPVQSKTFVLNLQLMQPGVYSLRLSSSTSSCVKRLILERL
ncbi:T9SS type A sorting domain-containing protein [Fluviicola sp.]|uniref:T9SS type A sorting domain-containing protein n=1 Tax=Fluviicola sp. TaxID=1917219 RepID=UPI003D2C77D4